MSDDVWADVAPYDDVSGEVAIVGIGETPYTAASDRNTVEMGLEAITVALDDAGLTPAEVDGLMFTGTSLGQVSADDFRGRFGTTKDLWVSGKGGSFVNSATATYDAAQAIRAGEANVIVNVFSTDWATQVKRQTGGPANYHKREPMKANLEVVHGWIPQPVYFATIARRYFHEFGADETALGEIAVSQRRHANGHPEAVMQGRVLTMDAYLARKPFIEPFRTEDCCLISDGGAAYVMTSAERARDLRQRPAIVDGVARARSHTTTYFSQQTDFTATPAKFSTEAAFAMAGIGCPDVDVLTAYDPFTIVSLMQIEDMGFCKKGEAADFIRNGRLAHTSTRRKGGLPFNTHGGLLSHAYVLGIAHVLELVKQLRGTAPNQVEDAEIGVFAGYSGEDVSTLVLRRGDRP